MIPFALLIVAALIVLAIVMRVPQRSVTEFRASLFEVLAASVRRGLPLAPVIGSAALEERGRRRDHMQRLCAHVEEGLTLSEALEHCAALALPMHSIASLRMAEGTPAFANVLEASARTSRTGGFMIVKLRALSGYAVIVASVTMSVSAGLVPRLQGVFSSVGVEPPAFAQWAMESGGAAAALVVLIGLAVMIVPLLGAFAARPFRALRGGLQPLPQYLPFVRGGARLRASAAALNAIAAVIRSGGRFDEALDAGALASGSGPLSASLERAAERAHEGEHPGVVWESTRFSRLTRARAAVGARAAPDVVGERLEALADQCLWESDRADRRLWRVVVPLETLMLGLLVGSQMFGLFSYLAALNGHLNEIARPW